MTQDNPTDPAGTPPTMPYAAPTAGGYMGPPPTPDDKNMAMLVYLLGLFTGFIGPLILWLIKKEQSPFINDQGKEVLNFQITVFLASIVCSILVFLLIGIILLPLLGLTYIVFMILGLLKAKDGVAYRFPFALRLLK